MILILCPFADCDIRGVQPPGSGTRESVSRTANITHRRTTFDIRQNTSAGENESHSVQADRRTDTSVKLMQYSNKFQRLDLNYRLTDRRILDRNVKSFATLSLQTLSTAETLLNHEARCTAKTNTLTAYCRVPTECGLLRLSWRAA